MKTFLLLLLLLAGGFAFWKYNETQKDATSSELGTITHTVVKGDTLHALSQKYNTSVTSIKQRNQLTSDTIHINDTLTIKPGESSTSTTPQPVVQQQPKPRPPQAAPAKPNRPSKPVAKKELPKSTVMESSSIAIDIDDKNQVYLKNANGKFAPAGTIIYGSDADANGMEIKTITYRDLKGKETTLPGSADPESVIRLALKKK
ncbi:LysM peptidoglycan-binding domain-containing protein [Rubritalea tangerina]|uniref:LysM peptidoglycan-binding domain-containing protein n=1 Tax=Rubritalea tangerina TaxID=430798 RepID=A0ABW4Z5R8_9BACT